MLGLALLLAALVGALTHRSWVAAQWRAAVVLATALDVPVVRWGLERFTDAPLVEERVVAGVPTTVARPFWGDGPLPALVFVNGATPRGRHHSIVQRLARGLARAGFLVLVPDPPGLAKGEITRETLAATVAVARAAADRPDAKNGRVGFAGVSVGTTLALLAAEDPALARRVTVVAGIAPYSDLANVTLLATTGSYRDERGRLARFEPEGFLPLVIGRSLVADLPPGGGRDELLDHLRAVDDDDPDPLSRLRRWPREELGPEARALVELLSNRDPARFDELYAALPAELREGIELLSPLRNAAALRAAVELVSPPVDPYFPLAESRALVQAAPDARLAVSSTLDHAIPELSFEELAGIFRLNAFIVRSLHAARRAGTS